MIEVPDERHVDVLCDAFGAFDLRPRLIALGYVGSISHGTHGEPIDDVDLMGIVVPPARHVVGLGGWEHWDYGPDENGIDCILYSVEKMIRLMVKSNPNVLGFLWLRDEHYLVRTRWLDELIAERDVFVSARAYRSFAGYANGQLKKMTGGAYKGYMGEKRKALVDKYKYDCKNASHLVRLLRTAIEFLENGVINVDRTGIDAEELREIKEGGWALDEVKAEADRLFALASAARDETDLRDDPDRDRAEAFLMRVQSAFVERDIRDLGLPVPDTARSL